MDTRKLLVPKGIMRLRLEENYAKGFAVEHVASQAKIPSQLLTDDDMDWRRTSVSDTRLAETPTRKMVGAFSSSPAGRVRSFDEFSEDHVIETGRSSFGAAIGDAGLVIGTALVITAVTIRDVSSIARVKLQNGTAQQKQRYMALRRQADPVVVRTFRLFVHVAQTAKRRAVELTTRTIRKLCSLSSTLRSSTIDNRSSSMNSPVEDIAYTNTQITQPSIATSFAAIPVTPLTPQIKEAATRAQSASRFHSQDRRARKIVFRSLRTARHEDFPPIVRLPAKIPRKPLGLRRIQGTNDWTIRNPGSTRRRPFQSFYPSCNGPRVARPPLPVPSTPAKQALVRKYSKHRTIYIDHCASSPIPSTRLAGLSRSNLLNITKANPVRRIFSASETAADLPSSDDEGDDSYAPSSSSDDQSSNSAYDDLTSDEDVFAVDQGLYPASPHSFVTSFDESTILPHYSTRDHHDSLYDEHKNPPNERQVTQDGYIEYEAEAVVEKAPAHLDQDITVKGDAFYPAEHGQDTASEISSNAVESIVTQTPVEADANADAAFLGHVSDLTEGDNDEASEVDFNSVEAQWQRELYPQSLTSGPDQNDVEGSLKAQWQRELDNPHNPTTSTTHDNSPNSPKPTVTTKDQNVTSDTTTTPLRSVKFTQSHPIPSTKEPDSIDIASPKTNLITLPSRPIPAAPSPTTSTPKVPSAAFAPATPAPPTPVPISPSSIDAHGSARSKRRYNLRKKSSQQQEAQIRADEERKKQARLKEERQHAKKLALEKEAAARRVIEEAERAEWILRGSRDKKLANLVQPVSEEWQKEVQKAMKSAAAANLATSVTGQPLTRRAFGTLLPGPGDSQSAWLNDEIVTAYLDLVCAYGNNAYGITEAAIKNKTAKPKYAAFSTQFMTVLRGARGYAGVARWAGRKQIGGESMLGCEYVFVPVHVGGNHWTIMIISPARRTVEYFDSFNHDGAAYTTAIMGYLRDELKEKFVAEEWRVWSLAGSAEQINGRDCGVFSVTTAKAVTLGLTPRIAFAQKDMMTQRMRMAAELIHGAFI